MIQIPECRIIIVDDDESVRKGISLLLIAGGYQTETFGSIADFLNFCDFNTTGCILLDIFLGEESGLEFHDAIKERFSNLPVIYITGHGDITMSVRALKNGALNFLQKPVDEKNLFPAVEEALDHSLTLFRKQVEKKSIKAKIDSLTAREFEIFRFVIRGALNKQIAAELNIAEHTVKLHRGKITEKLGVKSVPEMIYLAEKIQII